MGQDAIEKGWFRNCVPSVQWEVDLASITQTALQIAMGIQALHSLHIVHGVSPESLSFF